MAVLRQLYEQSQEKIDSPEFKKLLTSSLKRLGDLYSKNGYDLRIVGGAVRDLVLKKEPKDIDLASNATPQESIKMLQDDGIRVIETGLQHGTITAVIKGEEYEITTLRIDTDTDGRHATVKFTQDWKQDAERRDLTFNAMSLDLDGTLYDYFGGIEDLQQGHAHFVGSADSRIKEDYLRILRYFRFKGRLETPKFDKKTLDAIKDNAVGLQQISGERIWMELSKILAGNNTVKILKKMDSTNVDTNIGLSVHDLKELSRARRYTDSAPALLAALIHNEGQLESIVGQWKINSAERELARFIIINRKKTFNADTAMRMWTDPKIKDKHIIELARYLGKTKVIEQLQSQSKPVFPVKGKDLIQAGIKPGPQMGEILQRLEIKWKDERYKPSRDDLLKRIYEGVDKMRFKDFLISRYLPIPRFH